MPVTTHPTLTIARLIAVISCDETLPAKKRREICSALKRLAEITGADEASTLAEPGVFRKLFASMKWKQQGLSKGRWANIKTLAKEGLARAGVDVHRTRANFVLSETWEALLGRLPDKDARDLRRFAGWCTVLGVEPEAVDVAVFDQFLNYCLEQMTHRNPLERWHVARRAWNQAVALGVVPDGERIEIPDLDTWRLLKWSDFPDSLKADFDRFVAARTAKVVITAKQRCQLRPHTLKNYDRALRTLATCLGETGMSTAALTSLPVLLAPEHVRAGLEHYVRDDDLEDARSRLAAVAIAVKAVVTWLEDTGRLCDEEIALTRRYCKAVEYRPTVMTPKNSRQLAQFKDPKVVERFLNLPFVVFDRLASSESPTVRQAQEAQMAGLHSLMIYAPVRINNASQLSLTSNITRMKKGEDIIWLLEWKERLVKNKVTLKHQLAPASAELLELYCAKYRPLLLKEPRPELFISQNGGAKGPSSLSRQWAAFVARETGIEFHAHLIRHVMAFLYLKLHPGDYVTVQRLLGHKTLETTIRFYDEFEKEADHALYDEMITSLRSNSGKEKL